VTKNPSPREMDVLLATGEQASIALLCMALHAKDYGAISLTGPQAGIYADADHTRARITKILPKKVFGELAKRRIVVVAGFQGLNPNEDIATLGRGGSDLTAMALAENPTLSEYTGIVQDSGEGRWTVAAALEEAVPADVLTAALYTRFRSRQDHTFAEKMLSAMRQKFGGHIELTRKTEKAS